MSFDAFDDDIQRAALEPDRWPELLHGIGRQAKSLGAILISEAHRIPVPPISRDLEPLMSRYYGEGWNTRDIRFRGIETALRTGAVTDEHVLSRDEMARSPYYQELLRPEGCCWFCGIHFEVAGSAWFLTLQRTVGQGPFEPGEVARLKTLRRPLQTAASLSHALSFARVAGMADAFEHIAKPALILDERGLLMRCNERAEAMLDALADLRHREIRFKDGANQRAFDAALARAKPRGGPAPGAAVLRDAAGRGIAVDAIALGDWGRYSFTQASVLVFLDRVGDDTRRPEAALRARYGLTAAELRVATELAAGFSVRAIADRHRISYETARTQLKAVLSKTGTRRQSELVSLVLLGTGSGR